MYFRDVRLELAAREPKRLNVCCVASDHSAFVDEFELLKWNTITGNPGNFSASLEFNVPKTEDRRRQKAFWRAGKARY
ncbi:unnamed protein product [Strongylus vulgaris]|uniref:Uncharacterized protein n=1 Tax=Strongylus vulgaris TaxID=40348 RepID=A0A3P7JG62_STRVU|nr:unnamed protein product [Strongylus vulgaris]